MKVQALLWWAAALLAAGTTAVSGGPTEVGDMALKRSDVVFMGASAPQVYEQYGATVVSWGGRPWGDVEAAVQQYRERVEQAHELGIRYLPGAAFRTAFAAMIDFDPDFMDSVCRSLEGEPILVPWLWDHKHKGHPAYWFCTNSPGYRRYLKHQMANAFVAGAEGLHIDDYAGTCGAHWGGGGCFCPHCMAAFREHVRAGFPREKLQALGIVALDGFDYGEFLRGRGVTAEQFKERVGWQPENIPLSHEFLRFQQAAAVEWVAEYLQYCEGLAGRPLALCVNSAVNGPENLGIVPVVTFFSGEVEHEAESGQLSAMPVWSYKLGDAVARPVACTAAGWDWAFVAEKGKPGLVRAWIAQAYAFGHQFMPPVHQWCYTKEKGTHWYDAPPEEFAPFCRFVRENAELFDGYDAVAPVGLLYSNAAFRTWQRQARDACRDLALENVPFRIVMAGDDWMPRRLTPDDLAGLSALVVTEPTRLDPEQQSVLDGAQDIVVAWPDRDRLRTLLPPPVQVEGASGVTVVARVKTTDAAAPYVCHLVNRNYVPAADAAEPRRSFRLRLARSLFDEAVVGATLHAPGRKPRRLLFKQEESEVVIAVPELDLWAVLELEHEASDPAPKAERSSEMAGESQFPVRGLHVTVNRRGDVDLWERFIREALPAEGVNLLVMEINYGYAYESYPQVANEEALTSEDLARIAAACAEAGVELVPQFNCLGHQSWTGRSHGLLRAFPEFDETPNIPQDAGKDDLYCRSYCPLHPDVHEVIFALIDELAEATGAQQFHVGMDEVFLIGEDVCPRCAGKDRAELFAAEVTALRDHLAEKGLRMWMWGDRLINAEEFEVGLWEGSANDTWPAVDLIPKDVVICDWHYEQAFETDKFFIEKGFAVMTCPWRKPEVALEQVAAMRALRTESDLALGMLQTTWCGFDPFVRAYYGETDPAARRGRSALGAAECFKALCAAMREQDGG